MAKRKLKTSVTTEELAKFVADDIASWTPEQKAACRAALDREFEPSAKDKIKKQQLERFDKMTTENQKYAN